LRIHATCAVTNQETGDLQADHLVPFEQTTGIIYLPQQVNCNPDTGDLAQ